MGTAAQVRAIFYIRAGQYVLSVPCPGCGHDTLRCHPGAWPICWTCGAKVLRYGRTPEAECISPNGRIDAHLSYVRQVGSKLVCMFCGEWERHNRGDEMRCPNPGLVKTARR